MQFVIKYALAAIVGGGIVAIASLLWPKFTTKPQPQALQDVRSAVLGVQIGQNAAELLGVDGGGGPTMKLSDTVSSVAGIVTSSVEQKVQQIVANQVATQVIKQYQQLPGEQQNRVVETICKLKE